MSFRTTFLGLAEDLLKLQGPADFDIATSQLTVRRRTWAGGAPGAAGGYVDTDLVLPQHYLIRTVTAREIESSGGRFRNGDVRVGPITPSDGASVGYTPAQLRPSETSQGDEVLYILTGALAGEYELVEADFSRAFRYTLTLRSLARV